MPKFKPGDKVQVKPELKEWQGVLGIVICEGGEITKNLKSVPVVVELPRADLVTAALYIVQLDSHERPSLIAEYNLVKANS